MATVALLGIPIMMMRGEEPPSLPFVSGGITDKPRSELKEMLIKSPLEVKVVDMGELLPQPLSQPSEAATNLGIDYGNLGKIAKDAIEKSRADIVLAIGGDHSGAFPLYYLTGNVVRADAHGDAYVDKYDPFNYVVSGATYVFHVNKLGLKKPEEVHNVGVKYLDNYCWGKGYFGIRVPIGEVLRNKKLTRIGLFDLDLDVLRASYALPHGYKTSDLTVEDLTGLLIKSNPAVFGVFECVNTAGVMPADIISAHPNVFGPICDAVAEIAVARAQAAQNGSILQNPQAFSATFR
ncbi:hypothetical protein HYV85_02710 [Candidatus Woesearchaeota archaeon]|nr:hypothetical protein [Candidatus Woesearchaeota archaeon]